MKILFIGGTGNISSTLTRLVVERGHELHLVNRGKSRKHPLPAGVRVINHDVHSGTPPAELRGARYDVVVNWIAFLPSDVERDLAWFAGGPKGATETAGDRATTGQYIFISSASAYQKPPAHPMITESTPLANPYWEYSRNKIACEETLMRAHRATGFPFTVVRPSHTYDTIVPVAVSKSDFTIIDRIRRGLPIIIHGEGTSLWTLTHADDFARAFLGLCGNPRAIGHAFHITSDEWLTWDQILRLVGRAAGAEPNLVHVPSEFIAKLDPDTGAGLLGDKSWCALFDNSKVKAFVPGWEAQIPFAEGIKRTVAWFDADKSRQAIDAAANTRVDEILRAWKR
ncbi:MAG TPA: SDR family oxidoreductase [Polyangia bacterium]|jgi:nucleoside-diphosphate-sugar epimerase|nr:SDR family oxidoreductase [Polyangia bacterium]